MNQPIKNQNVVIFISIQSYQLPLLHLPQVLGLGSIHVPLTCRRRIYESRPELRI